ncbi:hypothetical protein DRQ25_11100 [Candidatus Fermentibacteria bacterium]|nr:MAG: hypothetical protein DRQ25_11100 [Candidatus Fermentibacteria bacterium]
MADKNVADVKTVNLFRNEEKHVRVIYDFATETGAVADDYMLMIADEALVITDFWVRGITELDSAADGATIDVGIDGGDEDILLDGVAEATVAAAALVQATVVEGAPNVFAMPLALAASGQIRLKIIGEALTSGKCEFNFVVRPFA